MADQFLGPADRLLGWGSLLFAVCWLVRVRHVSRRAARVGLLAVAPTVAWDLAHMCGLEVPAVAVALGHPDPQTGHAAELAGHSVLDAWLYAGLAWAVLADRRPPEDD